MITDSVPKELISTIAAIKSYSLAEGGFAGVRGGSFRPDSTAWAVIALRAYREDPDIVQMAQRRLAEVQGSDGRVAMSQKQPGAFWPTPLAILAWFKEPEFKEPTQLSINFMLSTSGTVFPPPDTDNVVKHDATLRGWPWNEDTHSWVVPSAIGLMALKACGYEGHKRAEEAVKLLLDRQLPAGGWNYGNTVVFEKELLANPECSGHALNALEGYVDFQQVTASIEYLEKEAVRLRSPLSLAWAILGLSAWSLKPEDSRKWLLECVAAQDRYGNYSVDLLSQIVIAYCAKKGLSSILENK